MIGLYIAYVIPIFLRWRMGDAFKPGPWNNGQKYRWMNLVATIWVGIITVIFCLPFTPAAVPWSDEFAWNAVNYAPIAVGGVHARGGDLVARQRAPLLHGSGAQREFEGEGLGVEPTSRRSRHAGTGRVVGAPVIGLCAALERARWAAWDQQAVLLPRNYVDAVQSAGGIALMLPPDPAAVDDPDRLLDLVDGLLLAGGADMDPATYGAEPHPLTVGSVPERDAFELALAARAMERDLPFLGICRGMQVMNVARGGTLNQHLPDDLGHEDHRRTPGSFDNADHDVRLAAGSLAARTAHEELHGTKSHHHQGVERIGEGLTVTGWATIDDLPEALELEENRFTLGVQWHPEADETSPLIAALVAQARAYREERVA